MARAVIYFVVGVGIIIGAATQKLVLRFTETSSPLYLIGGAIIAMGVLHLVRAKAKSAPPPG